MKTLKALIRALVVAKAEYGDQDNLDLFNEIETTICTAALTFARNQTPKTIAPQLNKWGLMADEVVLAHAGRKIDAIKAYRARTGLELKEAKNAVEAYLNDNGLPHYLNNSEL